MRIEGYRIWIILFIAIFIASGYLYHTIQKNRGQLNEQSIRSLELTKNNLLESWENYRVRADTIPEFFQENHSRLRGVLQELMDRMPPSEFFDHIVLTGENGKILISKPDIPVRSIQFNLNSDPDASEMDISSLGSQVFQDDQVFRVPLTLVLNQGDQAGRQELELHLFGVINQDTYDEASRQISVTTLYILFTLVLLLLVSFPILRVFGLGRGDILLRAHIFQVGLSIILLAIFIGFSISYLISRSETIKDQQTTVQALSDGVVEWHQNEISRYAGLLESYFQDGEETEDANKIDVSGITYNELFQIDRTGYAIRMKSYELGEELDRDALNVLPNLMNREYYRRAVQEAYFLGSHFSYADGRQEGVLSRKEENPNGEAADDSLPFVRAVTFSFDDFDRADVDSLNPLGLKYLIINESGEVFYQSPSITTVIPRIKDGVSPEQWIEIKTLMENNTELADSLDVPVSFEGQTYIANLRTFNFDNLNIQDPLWILTFRDKNLRYFRSYSTFMYSAIGYVTLVLLFLIIALFSYVTGKTSHYLNFKSFSFSWLRPSNKKRKNFGLLFVITALHVIFLLFILWYESHNFWFIVFLSCEIISIIQLFSYVLLSDFLKNWKQIRLWAFPVLVFLAAMAFSVLAYQASTGHILLSRLTIYLFVTQITGLAIIGLLNKNSWFSSGRNNRRVIKRFEHNISRMSIGSAETIFALTFTLWVLLVGLLPGYLIHHTALHYEDTIWHDAAELPVDRNEHHTREHPGDLGGVQGSFFDVMEYQRRQWLKNFAGLDYPVIDRYMYPGKEVIRGAVFRDDATLGHGKELSEYLLITILFIVFGSLLYLIIRVLSRRIFLTQYWDFRHEKGLVEDVGKLSYLITLDNRKAIEFLKTNFLKDKKFNVYDLSSSSVFEKLPSFSSSGQGDVEGLILLNIESALYSTEAINHLTDLITECKKTNKFIVMTGTKSLKELRDLEAPEKDHNFEKAMVNWIEATGLFVTIILPIDYGIDHETEPGTETGSEFIKKLKHEIRFGPHYSTLSPLLINELEKPGGKNITEKSYEKFLLIVQRINKAYYQNLWEKLSFREKQMVYNYANEGFVNYCNFDVLTELLQKGIFRMDHKEEEIRLFNQSYRNYTTQAASSNLMKKFKQDKKENGNLSHLRNAVLTFIFLAILGVSLIAPELLDRYIGAISGGLAILSSFASFANKLPANLTFLKDSSLSVQN